MAGEISAVGARTWPWPDSLDALVAAAEFHTLLLENDYVRVVHTHIRAGKTVPVHTHRWPCVLTIRLWSDMIRRDEHGKVLRDSRQFPTPVLNQPTWQEALPPHSVENVESGVIDTIQVEIKDRE
jgi:hypothetical protein